MSKIRINNGPYQGKERTLGTLPMVIGRDAEAHLQILDRSASRFHAEVFPVGGMYFLRDLNSKNGVMINDEPVTDEELLREGDVIKIGATEIIFESGSAVDDGDTSSGVAYQDDPDFLSNTIEFKVDQYSDIDEIEEDQNSYHESARSLKILYQVSKLLANHAQESDREAHVLDYLLRVLPAESALIFRREEDTGKLVPGLIRTAKAGTQPVISRTIIRKTFTENKALHIADAQHDDRLSRTSSMVQKNIRSVICVPLGIGDTAKGVLYFSRNTIDNPFEPIDMELISACAVQLGVSRMAYDQVIAARRSVVRVVASMVAAAELRGSLQGRGERVARTCTAIAHHLGLSQHSRQRLHLAGLLHHYPGLCSDDAESDEIYGLLGSVDVLESVLPLARNAWERLDGSGPSGIRHDDLGTEARILTVAVAFEEVSRADPEGEGDALVLRLSEDAGLDAEIIGALQAVHLDGSLYR